MWILVLDSTKCLTINKKERLKEVRNKTQEIEAKESHESYFIENTPG